MRDGGRGNVFADGGEILVEDVAILRDGDRVSYVPAAIGKGDEEASGKRKASSIVEGESPSNKKVLKREGPTVSRRKKPVCSSRRLPTRYFVLTSLLP